MVMCKKLQRELPGMRYKPFPDELGQRIYDEVSWEAWQQWLARLTMIMNETRLNIADPEADDVIREQMEAFFFGGGAAPPAGYVPPTDKK